jgi:hypothetical protein
MKYKVQKLAVDSDGIVDIPEGWIPLEYRKTFMSASDRGNYIDGEIIVLEPL